MVRRRVSVSERMERLTVPVFVLVTLVAALVLGVVMVSKQTRLSSQAAMGTLGRVDEQKTSGVDVEMPCYMSYPAVMEYPKDGNGKVCKGTPYMSANDGILRSCNLWFLPWKTPIRGRMTLVVTKKYHLGVWEGVKYKMVASGGTVVVKYSDATQPNGEGYFWWVTDFSISTPTAYEVYFYPDTDKGMTLRMVVGESVNVAPVAPALDDLVLLVSSASEENPTYVDLALTATNGAQQILLDNTKFIAPVERNWHLLNGLARTTSWTKFDMKYRRRQSSGYGSGWMYNPYLGQGD
jgi:hypothetical protein